MPAKLLALLVLIGTLGFLLLMYLYFFVYYTASIVFDTNVEGYTVELFSKSTAQKMSYDCPKMRCEIPDVSPFEYNITLTKAGYERQLINAKITPRRRQEFIIKFDKKLQLNPTIQLEESESIQEKIQRISSENDYYAVFSLENKIQILFGEVGDTLELWYKENEQSNKIKTFQKVPPQQIYAQKIYESEDIFLKIGEKQYIFYLARGTISEIPLQVEVKYVKKGAIQTSYLFVTQLGVFEYNAITNTLEYKYLFKDYISLADEFIGIVFADEEQKKKNFNLETSGNLLVKYSPKTKVRKIIYSTSDDIEKIYTSGEKIFLEIEGNVFELENY